MGTTTNIKLKKYDDWKKQIISSHHFNDEYINKQISLLKDTDNEDTKQFLVFYGEKNINELITYFEKLLQELKDNVVDDE